MSSDASTKPTTRDLAWAYAVTGISPDATDDAVRARFLSRLEASEFVPGVGDMSLDDPAVADESSRHRGRPREQPLSAQRAIAFEAILRHRAGQSALGEASHLEHLWHRDQVERFAARFFSLGVTERVAEYERLAQRVEHLPTVVARLRSLTAGLGIDAAIADRVSPDVRQLVRTVLAMFPLSATEHAAMEAAFFYENAAAAARWSKSAEQLEQKCARIAELDSSFIQRLREWPEEIKVAKQSEKAKRAARPQRAASTRTTTQRTQWSASSSGMPIVAIVIFVVGILRAVFDGPQNNVRNAPHHYDYAESRPEDLPSRWGATPNIPKPAWPFQGRNGATTPKVDESYAAPDAELLAKSDDLLTVHDKNRLIHYGFSRNDAELELSTLARLYSHGMIEARKMWRETHAALPKELIPELDLTPLPPEIPAGPDGEPRTSP